MERIKRREILTIHDSMKNKKQKFEKSYFEDLANEIIYDIFDYLDFFHSYQGFFNLNHRFKSLFFNPNFPIQMNLSSISKSDLDFYHKNFIQSNKHRIKSLHLSNPFIVDMIFSPPRNITKFLHLERLILDQFQSKYLDNILLQLSYLPKLYSLTIHSIDYIENPTNFYIRIFRLSKLKYCQIESLTNWNMESLGLFTNELSSIERLAIKTYFQIESLQNLLLYLPQLRYLSIDSLDSVNHQGTEFVPIILKNFKHVSFQLKSIDFNRFEKIVKSFFQNIEILEITTQHDPEYLNARRWEELITNYMPNLRVFDINHDGTIRNESPSYHHALEQFNSSFWTKRKWFFTHQHDWEDILDSGTFYSTKPYRRKDYNFYWESEKPKCRNIHEINIKSVKHVFICGENATDYSNNYFPNAIELTIQDGFEHFDYPLLKALNRILPLNQLKRLNINSFELSFELILELIHHTFNLQYLKFNSIFFDDANVKSIQTTNRFQSILKRNQITHLDLGASCSLEEIQLISNLFLQLKYFKTKMVKKDVIDIIRYLLLGKNLPINHLFFLCITQINRESVKKIKILITNEKLLKNYLIKFINKNLYLWW